MEFVEGTRLTNVWFDSDLEDKDITSITRQLVKFESMMLVQDLKKIVGRPSIPLEDKRFCAALVRMYVCLYGKVEDHSSA